MTNNIYRVINEQDLNEILSENSHRLVCIVFLTKYADSQLNIKKCLIKLAYENPNNFFVYIDLNSFVFTEKRFTFERLPITYYYLDNEEVANVQGNNVDKIYDTFNQLIKLINQKISENKTTVNINTNFFNSKNQQQVEQPNVTEQSNVTGQSNITAQSNVTEQSNVTGQPTVTEQPNVTGQPINDQENEQTNSQIIAFQKLREMQQSLAIQQLEKLKKIKELEERYKV